MSMTKARTMELWEKKGYILQYTITADNKNN